MKSLVNHFRSLAVFCILILVIPLIFNACSGRNGNSVAGEDDKAAHPPPDSAVLAGYREQTTFTDPGKYAYLYNDLPESMDKVCDLIKMQLIHPMEAREMMDMLPEKRGPEDGDFPIVADMLQELTVRDSSGLTMERKPEDRLIVACYHHGLLLASILRHRNIPVRLRGGFARYYEKEAKVRFGHVICEVWDDAEQGWVLIDPDRNIIKVTNSRFEFPSEAWQNFYGTKHKSIRYVSSIGEGFQALIHALLLDQAFVLGDERNYWHTPEFIFTKSFNLDSLENEQIQIIDQIALLMNNPETNLSGLQQLYTENGFLYSCERSIDTYYEKIYGETLDD